MRDDNIILHIFFQNVVNFLFYSTNLELTVMLYIDWQHQLTRVDLHVEFQIRLTSLQAWQLHLVGSLVGSLGRHLWGLEYSGLLNLVTCFSDQLNNSNLAELIQGKLWDDKSGGTVERMFHLWNVLVWSWKFWMLYWVLHNLPRYIWLLSYTVMTAIIYSHWQPICYNYQ